jgi:hypothetical protein
MCKVPGASWQFIAREAQRRDGLSRLRSGRALEQSAEATKTLAALTDSADLAERQRIVEEMLASAESDGIRLTTVLDDDYPTNLRTIYNLPPFLLYLGTFQPEDVRSVAVVGTRAASPEGIIRAEWSTPGLMHTRFRGLQPSRLAGCWGEAISGWRFPPRGVRAGLPAPAAGGGAGSWPARFCCAGGAAEAPGSRAARRGCRPSGAAR